MVVSDMTVDNENFHIGWIDKIFNVFCQKIIE